MICFRADIPRFPLTVFSVFNCFRWTMADAGHAVGTVLSPYGFPVFHTYVVQRTDFGALSTGDAGVGSIEFFCMNKYWIKEIIYNSAVHSVLECDCGPRKCLAVFDRKDRFVYRLFRPLNDLQ